MSPFERERRKREIEAESIQEDYINEMIQSRDEEHYLVQSFTLEDIEYEVLVSENTVCNCACPDFSHFQQPCKHMYLLLRCFPNFTITSINLLIKRVYKYTIHATYGDIRGRKYTGYYSR